MNPTNKRDWINFRSRVEGKVPVNVHSPVFFCVYLTSSLEKSLEIGKGFDGWLENKKGKKYRNISSRT